MKTINEKIEELNLEQTIKISEEDLELLKSKLVLLLKIQDRDTRHTCAEACLSKGYPHKNIYHDICMNVRLK